MCIIALICHLSVQFIDIYFQEIYGKYPENSGNILFQNSFYAQKPQLPVAVVAPPPPLILKSSDFTDLLRDETCVTSSYRESSVLHRSWRQVPEVPIVAILR